MGPPENGGFVLMKHSIPKVRRKHPPLKRGGGERQYPGSGCHLVIVLRRCLFGLSLSTSMRLSGINGSKYPGFMWFRAPLPRFHYLFGQKGDLEPIICMSPAVLMVSWVADVWPVNCTGYASPLNRSVSLFQSGTQPAHHAHLRPTGVINFPAPGFTSKIVLICRLGRRGTEGNVRAGLLVMVISASGDS